MVKTDCSKCGKMFLQGPQTSRTECYDCAPLPPLPPESLAEAIHKEDPDRVWKRICPDLYQRTDLSRLTAPWVEQILSWQKGAKGLLVVGDTGAGKTRVVWMLIKRLLSEDRQLSVRYTDSVNFRSSMANAARDGETDQFLISMARSPLLFFDDLGQMKVTEAASEMLLHVVNKRSEYDRPCIFTTQYRGAEFTAQFDRPQQGSAIRRRLTEFCSVIQAHD
jgi:DNA replication protein DnaC